MAQNTADQLTEALDRLTKNDEKEEYKARKSLRELVARAGAPGNNGGRSEVAGKLAQSLGDSKKYSPRARGEIARQLADIAGDAEIPTLRKALDDLEVRESARYALDRIPTKAATQALAEAAQTLIGRRFRVGLINALGQRSGPEAFDALKALASDPDRQIRVAVGEAVANQADSGADAVIVQIMQEKGDPLTSRDLGRLMKARVRLAGVLARADRKADAKKVLEAILAGSAPAAQQKAAKIGLESLG